MSIAGIVKEIALSPSVDIIEIWDKDSYETAIEITDEEFEVLAEDVMGDLGENTPNVS
jgi:MraZ protein